MSGAQIDKPEATFIRSLDHFQESNNRLLNLAIRYEDLLQRIQGNVPQDAKEPSAEKSQEPNGYLDRFERLSKERSQYLDRIDAVLNRMEEHF